MPVRKSKKAATVPEPIVVGGGPDLPEAIGKYERGIEKLADGLLVAQKPLEELTRRAYSTSLHPDEIRAMKRDSAKLESLCNSMMKALEDFNKARVARFPEGYVRDPEQPELCHKFTTLDARRWSLDADIRTHQKEFVGTLKAINKLVKDVPKIRDL